MHDRPSLASKITGASRTDVDRLRTSLAAAAASLLGAMLLFTVMLSPLEAAHEAAHDTRHVLSVPCD